MLIKNAKFIKSSASYKECPKTNHPEFAFIGRSNVGKSSLINMITNQKKLAKTSNTPGKTQLINHFMVNEHWYLVDLPGYGYAKVSKSSRSKWEKMIRDYFFNSENLACVIVLIDSRVPPQQLDIDFVNMIGEMEMPFVIVYTKTDKLSTNQATKNQTAFEKELLKHWEALPQSFSTSAKTSAGRDELLDFIEETAKVWFG